MTTIITIFAALRSLLIAVVVVIGMALITPLAMLVVFVLAMVAFVLHLFGTITIVPLSRKRK